MALSITDITVEPDIADWIREFARQHLDPHVVRLHMVSTVGAIDLGWYDWTVE